MNHPANHRRRIAPTEASIYCLERQGTPIIQPADNAPHCPLCRSSDCAPYHRDRRRAYLQCGRCTLVYVPSRYHLSAIEEKAEYDKHRNVVDDPGYRRFLSRLSAPLCQRLPAGSRGLDFGCGPGPALAAVLRESGFDVNTYDVFYQPARSVLSGPYDFITATEVVEHLSAPGAELDQLWQLLRPGGLLGLMTKLIIDRKRFATWHYINDPTHITFFSRNSLAWLADTLGAKLEILGPDVVILSK